MEEEEVSEVLDFIHRANLDDPQEAEEVAFSLLQNLPNEVLYLVFEFLDWKSLHSLCQASLGFLSSLCQIDKFHDILPD